MTHWLKSGRTRRGGAALAVLLAATAVAGHATAQTAPAQQQILGQPYTGPAVATPRGADGKPVLTGYWKLLHEDGKPDGNLAKDEPGFVPPLTPAGREALAFNQTVIDPEARCLITGIPRLLTSVLPFEILQTPDRLATLHQLSWHRWVWLDGRARDPEQDPKYLGNALGHWDGDVLVIESSGFHDSSAGNLWLDDNANPISADAVVVERWSRPDRNHLVLELTYTDPRYYSRPITYRRTWVLAPEGEHLQEFSCEWNTPWILKHLERGPGPIGPNGNRGYGPNNQITPDLPLGAVEGTRGVGYWLFRANKPKPSDLPVQP
ncbi:hypothetical protein [Brevundimonas nasdae]|uniref:hypothetical protein n=1 Tax=Brevundimonas nasdae TaxID=172043 RepID=UPI0028A1D404|nr:hypothetical protein [Brevundimonas nasdae]